MIRLALRVPREHAETVLAELLDLAPGGVEEMDLGDRVEYAVYGPAGELPALPDLRAAAGGVPVEVVTTEVADDWAERWRDFHRPVVIGDRLHLRPPWAEPRHDLEEVVIDPGQAFGTGAHDTTRLCLELLLELEPAGALIDLGCGSGVLAVAAAKLGWEPVHGLDHDAQAIEATHANARANHVTVQAARFDLLRDGRIPAAPTVTANLLRPLLLAASRAGFGPEPPTALIASGLLPTEADEIAAAFAHHGLREVARRQTTGWAALLLRRA
ncbi:MAG TPA: 50S ribosomal protein L11 methyltransferase [Solirubrobacteraceae bacterium]|nr:50S ribosomal protein L11 methyltransferase [Solirubrobacteraceae bacterium]